MAMSSAALMATQSSGANSSTLRQYVAASSDIPSAAAWMAHRLKRSASMGTHRSPRAPARSSNALRPRPLSRRTRAYTSSASRLSMAPAASNLTHIPAASCSIADGGTGTETAAAASMLMAAAAAAASASRDCSSMLHTAHMMCLGSLVRRYSFMAHCCCLTKTKSRAYAAKRTSRWSTFLGALSAAASYMASDSARRPVFL
mmetsp:Transcript_27900/g.70084  ORF Transcript_27900/g.70084 Transcript_27900/m.70084 type:complete len:202 (+) Transcript_27900:319-924(+)